MIELASLTSWVVFAACVTGLAARTLIPYWDKIQKGEIKQFDLKFLGTVAIAFVGALTPSMMFFPTIIDNIPDQYAQMGLPFVFIFVAIAAYGANDAVNYGLKKVGEKKEQNNIAGLKQVIHEVLDEREGERK
jgi:ABC-type multidrug transport system fused ATPase/permease subunit